MTKLGDELKRAREAFRVKRAKDDEEARHPRHQKERARLWFDEMVRSDLLESAKRGGLVSDIPPPRDICDGDNNDKISFEFALQEVCKEEGIKCEVSWMTNYHGPAKVSFYF